MKRIGYALISDMGEYEDETKTIMAVFLDKRKAEELMAEYQKKEKKYEGYEPTYYYLRQVNVYDDCLEDEREIKNLVLFKEQMKEQK